MEYVSTNNAPGAIGPYSQAVKTGNLLFTSGQIAINPATGNVEATTIETQTRQVCENLKAVVEAAGTSLDKAVKTVCFLADIADFAKFNEVYGTYFTAKPARSCGAFTARPTGVVGVVEVSAALNPKNKKPHVPNGSGSALPFLYAVNCLCFQSACSLP